MNCSDAGFFFLFAIVSLRFCVKRIITKKFYFTQNILQAHQLDKREINEWFHLINSKIIEGSHTNNIGLSPKEHGEEYYLHNLRKAGKSYSSLTLDYLGGHPDISGYAITITPGIGSNALIIDSKELQVKSITWDEKGQRSLGKAATGAIIGGALTGGVGLLIGGAIGGKKKDASTAYVIVEENDMEYTLCFRCIQSEYARLSRMIQVSKLDQENQEDQQQETEHIGLASTVQPTNDIYDQIEKLAKLKDMGIITEEEFTAKKKQLLGL